MACLCCTSKRFVQENLMMEFKTWKTDVVFFPNFCYKFKKTVTLYDKRTCKIEMMMNLEL